NLPRSSTSRGDRRELYREDRRRRILARMRYEIRGALSIFALAMTCSACGGARPEPKDASDEPAKAEPAPETKSDTAATPSSSDTSEKEPSADERAAKTESSPGAEPTFPDGASVDQAMAAVPKGAARANLDADRLAEPLQQESVYEPCKVGSQHFKV